MALWEPEVRHEEFVGDRLYPVRSQVDSLFVEPECYWESFGNQKWHENKYLQEWLA